MKKCVKVSIISAVIALGALSTSAVMASPFMSNHHNDYSQKLEMFNHNASAYLVNHENRGHGHKGGPSRPHSHFNNYEERF